MILDASAFLAALGRPRVAAMFEGAELAAPDLLIPETLNSLWKLARSNLPVPERGAVLALFDKIRILPSRPYASRAAEIADEFDHPVYDCIYLAAAEAEADVLLTADARLGRKLSKSVLRKRIRIITAAR